MFAQENDGDETENAFDEDNEAYEREAFEQGIEEEEEDENEEDKVFQNNR